MNWSKFSAPVSAAAEETTDTVAVPSMAATVPTPSTESARSMIWSAHGEGFRPSPVSSGSVTAKETVLEAMDGIMEMPMFTTPTTAATRSPTATASGSTLWRRANCSERP